MPRKSEQESAETGHLPKRPGGPEDKPVRDVRDHPAPNPPGSEKTRKEDEAPSTGEREGPRPDPPR